MLLYLFQVWYKNSSICSVLWVLWWVHRAPSKAEFSKWSSHGFWRLDEVFWGKTHRNSKPGLNAAKRCTDPYQQWSNLTPCTSFLRCCALWAHQEQSQPTFYSKNYFLQKCSLKAKSLIQYYSKYQSEKQAPFQKSLSNSLSNFILVLVNYLHPANIRHCFMHAWHCFENSVLRKSCDS